MKKLLPTVSRLKWGWMDRIQNPQLRSHWAIKTLTDCLAAAKDTRCVHTRVKRGRGNAKRARTDFAASTINNPQDQTCGKQQLSEGNVIGFSHLMINRVPAAFYAGWETTDWILDYWCPWHLKCIFSSEESGAHSRGIQMEPTHCRITA